VRFSKVLIANRGEIAVRVIAVQGNEHSAWLHLGITVHAFADRHCIGPAKSARSYWTRSIIKRGRSQCGRHPSGLCF